MRPRISIPSSTEMQIVGDLRSAVLDAVGERGLTYEEVAHSLGLLPSAARDLLRNERWSLEKAVRVADALGVHMSLSIRSLSSDA